MGISPYHKSNTYTPADYMPEPGIPHYQPEGPNGYTPVDYLPNPTPFDEYNPGKDANVDISYGSADDYMPEPWHRNVSTSKTDVNTIYGLPPAAYQGCDYTDIILNSMPVVELTPGYPQYAGAGSTGLKLYKFGHAEGKKQFSRILDGLEMSTPELPLPFAFQYEAPITESFSNEYGESMFEDVGNFKIPFIREAKYITGTSSTSDMLSSLKNVFGDDKKMKELTSEGGALSGNLGGIISSLGNAMISGSSKVAKGATGFITANFGSYAGQILKLLEGSNIDFPKMWNNSTYTPSYTANIKLINPYPRDEESYDRFILQPLAYLLAFANPISDSESTFTFPLLCRVNCPGLFQIDSGYIQSVDVIKGGEAGDITFNQRPGTVEVRLTFAEMYNTMISADIKYQADMDADRPTLRKYIKNLKGSTEPPEWGMHNRVYTGRGVKPSTPDTLTVLQPMILDPTTPRVASASINEYNTLASKQRPSIKEASGYGPTPLIHNVDKKLIKNYEDAAADNDKSPLMRQFDRLHAIEDDSERFDALLKAYPYGYHFESNSTTINGVERGVSTLRIHEAPVRMTQEEYDNDDSDLLGNDLYIDIPPTAEKKLEEAKLAVETAAISTVPKKKSQNVDMQKAGIDSVGQATNNSYVDWKSAPRSDNSIIPSAQNNVGSPIISDPFGTI